MSSNFGTVRSLHLMVFAVTGGGGPCATPCANPSGAVTNTTIRSAPQARTPLRIDSIHFPAATVVKSWNFEFFIYPSANQPSTPCSFLVLEASGIALLAQFFGLSRCRLFDYAMKRVDPSVADTHPIALPIQSGSFGFFETLTLSRDHHTDGNSIGTALVLDSGSVYVSAQVSIYHGRHLSKQPEFRSS